MPSELLAIIESQQETIATLTKLLELELAKDKYRLPNPPNRDTMKYTEMMKPTCGYQPLTGAGYELGNPPKQE